MFFCYKTRLANALFTTSVKLRSGASLPLNVSYNPSFTGYISAHLVACLLLSIIAFKLGTAFVGWFCHWGKSGNWHAWGRHVIGSSCENRSRQRGILIGGSAYRGKIVTCHSFCKAMRCSMKKLYPFTCKWVIKYSEYKNILLILAALFGRLTRINLAMKHRVFVAAHSVLWFLMWFQCDLNFLLFRFIIFC